MPGQMVLFARLFEIIFYSYFIEDIAIGYILYINNIHVQAYPFYVDNPSLKK